MATTSAVPPRATPGSLVTLVTAVRWGTTAVGLALAAALGIPGATFWLGLALLGYCLWRTLQPIDYGRGGWKSLISILVELALVLAMVVATDCFDSPYIFVLFVPVIAAGFERGLWHSLRIAAAGMATVTLAAYLLDLTAGVRPTITWAAELVLVACVASYGRRMKRRAEEADARSLDQMHRLSQANSLLVSLTRVAHELPVSFDLGDTIEDVMSNVRAATGADLTALLLLDPATNTWTVAHAKGSRLNEAYSDDDLPTAVSTRARAESTQLVTYLSEQNPGLSPESQTAIYAPLWAGSAQVGLIAVEAGDPTTLDESRRYLLADMAHQMAVTIDNARRFEKLRARSATQERTRIARDLHDRVGQGVAYIAFELDRLCETKQFGTELEYLREDARKIVTELRETLHELRGDVSDEHGLTEAITEFLKRVSHRSSIQVSFTHEDAARLPVATEREVWRIAQEAIVNAERHSQASHLNVSWTLNEQGGLLTVTDDGEGIRDITDGARQANGTGSYGILGMRERANILGARLDIERLPQAGTTVRLTLPPSSNSIPPDTDRPEARSQHV